jgi:hypothetical protein
MSNREIQRRGAILHNGKKRFAQSSSEALDVISKAAYLTCYSGFDVLNPSNEFPLLPYLPEIGYQRELFQVGRRIQMTVTPPTIEAGFQVRNTVSREVITLNYLILKIVPNYFEPNFQTKRGLNPAPTVLLPFLRQKSMLIDEKFDLLDKRGSKLHLDGVSRTYPATGGIFIAGVGDITESYGYVQDAIGHIGVSGYSRIPPNFSLILVFRLVDPTGKLIAKSPLPPIRPDEKLKDIYPFSILLTMMGEIHPDREVLIEQLPDSRKKRIRFVERLRLCDVSTDVRPGIIESYNALGPVVGERKTTLIFDPDDTNDVIPLYSVNSEFKFFAERNKLIGTLKVELSEARAIRTHSPALAEPYFRIGGYGNFLEGTGQFKQVQGVLTSTGALSLSPMALSTLYILRINDHLHRFRPLSH